MMDPSLYDRLGGAFAIAAVVALVISFLLGQRWQAQIRDLMGASSPSPVGLLLLPVVGVLVLVGLVALGRLLRKAYHWMASQLGRWIGPRAALTGRRRQTTSRTPIPFPGTARATEH